MFRMKSLAAIVIGLLLLRLPMVAHGLDMDDTMPEGRLTPAEVKMLAQENSPWLADQLQSRYQKSDSLQAACKTQQTHRQVAQLLFELAEDVARRAGNLICSRKRNSEIINSLLGLPKVINNSGRQASN